jgi:hypothetical protein
LIDTQSQRHTLALGAVFADALLGLNPSATGVVPAAAHTSNAATATAAPVQVADAPELGRAYIGSVRSATASTATVFKWPNGGQKEIRCMPTAFTLDAWSRCC